MKNGSNDAAPPRPKEAAAAGYQFGTFQGVYVPSLITILGVIMYLRFGWVLGQVGLWGTLTIVTLATAIVALTALSISALATNMRIRGGGAYYIISRSLGVEAGGAVGIPFFLAKAISISFYVSGFAESISTLLPSLPAQGVGVITLVALTGLAYLSTDLALKTQFLILALIGGSLVSFFLGGASRLPAAPPAAAASAGVPFWAVFAVFFPAVTGIESGLALSGDLKNPAKALPRGTLGAVLTSYVIYMAIPLFLNRVVEERTLLLTHHLILRDIAAFGPLVLYGLWGASLSSALGSLLGAPRTLQALARDRVVPFGLGKGFGKGNDPHLATFLTFLIALGGILSGGLNVIAPVLTMFFLTAYGFLNVSALLEGLIGSPAWRPQFRIAWFVPFLGAAACTAAMFMINPGATFVAMVVCLTVYSLLKRRRFKGYWGDIRYGILMLMARFALYRMVKRQPDERTWRPNLLVLSGSPTARWYLIALADAISHGQGFLTVAAVVPEKVSSEAERVEGLRDSILEYLKKRHVPALVKVHACDDALEGAQDLVKAYGFGPIVPNTLLLGETEKMENLAGYVRLIRMVYQSRRNLIIVRESEAPPTFSKESRIDVWWSHAGQNAGLTLALAYLLRTSPEWTRSRLVLKTIVESSPAQEEAVRGLRNFLKESRVEAEVEALVWEKGNVFDAIRGSSQGAALVFLGMRPPHEGESDESYAAYYEGLMGRTDGFPSVAIVLAAEEIEFDWIFASPGWGLTS